MRRVGWILGGWLSPESGFKATHFRGRGRLSVVGISHGFSVWSARIARIDIFPVAVLRIWWVAIWVV